MWTEHSSQPGKRVSKEQACRGPLVQSLPLAGEALGHIARLSGPQGWSPARDSILCLWYKYRTSNWPA